MSERNWHPLKDIDSLRHQMNNLFDEVIHKSSNKAGLDSSSAIPKVENATWEPAIEIKETDSNLILQAQVPGIEPKDLDIHVTKDAVSISGDHEEQKVHYEKGIYRSEFSYGHFQRIIPLPMCVEYNKVKAEIHNGLLTLNLPKSHVEKHDVLKLDLMQEKARESMVQQRQHEEHIEETMHSRAQAEINAPSSSTT